MKKLLFCLFLCLFSVNVWAQDAIPALDKAGLASLVNQNKGKVIMLNFFATWCPPCRVELPELVKLRLNYPESDFLLIGLSVDENRDTVPQFIKLAGVNYPVYMAGQDITEEFRISSVPHNTFYAPDGKIIISEPGMATTDVLEKVVNDLMATK